MKKNILRYLWTHMLTYYIIHMYDIYIYIYIYNTINMYIYICLHTLDDLTGFISRSIFAIKNADVFVEWRWKSTATCLPSTFRVQRGKRGLVTTSPPPVGQPKISPKKSGLGKNSPPSCKSWLMEGGRYGSPFITRLPRQVGDLLTLVITTS